MESNIASSLPIKSKVALDTNYPGSIKLEMKSLLKCIYTFLSITVDNVIEELSDENVIEATISDCGIINKIGSVFYMCFLILDLFNGTI